MPKYSRFPKDQFPFTPTPKFQLFFWGGGGAIFALW